MSNPKSVNLRIDAAVWTTKEKRQKMTASFPASPPKSRDLGVLAAIFCLFSLVAFATLAPTPALAEQKRIFQHAFGCETAGVNGCTVADPYPIPFPTGVAVDEKTHDVYVADALNDRVEKFNAKGEFVLMFGKEVNLTEVLAHGGEAKENLCTAESLDACQPGTAGGYSRRVCHLRH